MDVPGAPVQGKVIYNFGRTLGRTFRKWLTQSIVEQVGFTHINFSMSCTFAGSMFIRVYALKMNNNYISCT